MVEPYDAVCDATKVSEETDCKEEIRSTDMSQTFESEKNKNEVLEESQVVSARDSVRSNESGICDEVENQFIEIDLTENCCEIIDSNFISTSQVANNSSSQDSVQVEESSSVHENSDATSVSLYKFDNIPIQITGAWKEFDSFDNFTRGCKWAPDGSCILTCSNDNSLRIFNFPTELWQENFNWEDVGEMSSVLKVKEGGCIYDYAWYPNMSSADPDSCCFASTSYNAPVHLWDAFTGQLRCSYRPYNHLDEVNTPNSIAFDSSGEHIYCGFKKIIRVFNVSLPGRECIERPTYVKKSGQAGILSCFAFSSALSNMSAVGSYNSTIGLYSEPSGYLGNVLVGHKGGITHLMFSPDGTKLFSGGRKDLEILCWDLRNVSSALFSARRLCITNQRLYFDISKCGKFLISGNHNGVVTIWDLSKTAVDLPNSTHPVLQPEYFYQAHDDCVNGVSFHPNMPIIATCSGQRKFPDPVDSDSDDNDGSHKKPMFTNKYLKKDNSLRLWLASECA